MKRRTKISFIAAVVAGLCVFTFENCSKVGFAPSQVNLGSLVAQGASLDKVVVTTKKNAAITFSAGTHQGKQLGALSLGPSPALMSINTGNGTLQILDPVAYTLKYTPNESYVGTDLISVYATDVYGNSIPGKVTVIVGNSLNTIQPALMVRGLSCITCHSAVASNIVTDYGFGSPWYFDTTSSDSFYSDRLNTSATDIEGLATLRLLNGSKIIVPKATVPSAIQSKFSVTSLSQFIQTRFTQGSSNLSSQVSEVNALKISLPTAARIQQIFGNPTAQQVYIPDTQNSPALQGLNFNSANQVFTITNLVCDGDLYLGATVMFDNATVTSISGCRIYATGSIFIDGTVQSVPYQGAANYNTQLMSARSIWMGSGKMMKNGSFCDRDANNVPVGWYSASANTGAIDCTLAANANSVACDSFNVRAANILSRNTYSRAYPDITSIRALLNTPYYAPGQPAVGTASVERANVEASLGHPLYDASCGPQRRKLNISRLMLVAPYVSNRYAGDFSGSTIAEAALMSLGTFQYEFDPVLSKVSIFSMLDNGELVSGDGL